MQGSHVLQFGSLSIDEEPVGDYLGDENIGKPECNTCYMVTLSQLTVTLKLSSSSAHVKLHHVQPSATTQQVLLQPFFTSVTTRPFHLVRSCLCRGWSYECH